MNRKKNQNQKQAKENNKTASSMVEKLIKTVPDQQDKDKEQNYPSKPHMLFR